MNEALWVVSAYQNPCQYTSRLSNFKAFRDRLNAQLLVVELKRDGDFELTDEDADILIQLRGEDRLWQKECLINIGASNLPDSAKYICWLDCDLIFERDDWTDATVKALEQGLTLVQPFEGVKHQSKFREPVPSLSQVACDELSYSKSLTCEDGDQNESMHRAKFVHGHGWAMRLQQFHECPLFDGFILGGADTLMCAAADRTIQKKIINTFDVEKKTLRKALSWAKKFGPQRIGHIPGKVFHLYHGQFKKRSYITRHKMLRQHSYEPDKSIYKASNGTIAWKDPTSKLAYAVADYFWTRQEDDGLFEFTVKNSWVRYRGYSHGMGTPSLAIDCIFKGNESNFSNALERSRNLVFQEDCDDFEIDACEETPSLLINLFQILIHSLRAIGIPERKQIRIRSDPESKNRYIVHLPAQSTSSTAIAIAELQEALKQQRSFRWSDEEVHTLIQRYILRLDIAASRYKLLRQNPRLIVQAAQELGLPVTKWDNFCVEVGHGQYSQRLSSSATDATSAVASQLVKDKYLTARWLRKNGLPSTTNKVVQSWEEIQILAKAWGFPLVIKPNNLDGGVGVYANLVNLQDLYWAYSQAKQHSGAILLEKHVHGEIYRVTICNENVISFTRKLPPGVFGNGLNTIAQLIEAENEIRSSRFDPRIPSQFPLTLDDEAERLLSQLDFDLNTAPDDGVFVPLKRRTNASAGGITEVLDTKEIHPRNLELCIAALTSVGLNIGAIDLIIPHVSHDWTTQNCAICEINSQPQIGFPAATKMLQSLVGNGGRIPIAVLTNTSDNKNFEINQLQKFFNLFSYDTISYTTATIKNGKLFHYIFEESFSAATAAIRDPKVSSLLCVMNFHDVKKYGWPMDIANKLIIYSEEKSNKTKIKELYLREKAKGHFQEVEILQQRIMQ